MQGALIKVCTYAFGWAGSKERGRESMYERALVKNRLFELSSALRGPRVHELPRWWWWWGIYVRWCAYTLYRYTYIYVYALDAGDVKLALRLSRSLVPTELVLSFYRACVSLSLFRFFPFLRWTAALDAYYLDDRLLDRCIISNFHFFPRWTEKPLLYQLDLDELCCVFQCCTTLVSVFYFYFINKLSLYWKYAIFRRVISSGDR